MIIEKVSDNREKEKIAQPGDTEQASDNKEAANYRRKSDEWMMGTLIEEQQKQTEETNNFT